MEVGKESHANTHKNSALEHLRKYDYIARNTRTTHTRHG
jgi:hypothetical protein